MINDVIKERRKRLVFELDFKKTYDRVNWDFLESYSRKVFGER